MSKKWKILTAVLLLAAFLLGGIGGWAVKKTPAGTGDLSLSAGYDNGLTAALRAAESLKLNLNKAAVSGGGVNQALLLTGAREDALSVARSLEGLPLGPGMQNEMLRYLRQMAGWCDGMARGILLGETLSADDTEQLLRENGTVASLVLELREGREQLGTADFSAESIGKRQAAGASYDRLADFFGYESELEATVYPSLSYTGLLSGDYLNRKATGLVGQEADEEAMLLSAAEFMEKVLTEQVTCRFLGLSEGTVPLGFVEAVTNSGARWNLTVSRTGGKILSAYGEAAPGETGSITPEEGEKKALELLKLAGFEECKIISRDLTEGILHLEARVWKTGDSAASADICRVWVDASNGQILAFDAADYYRNTKTRTVDAAITKEEALGKLSERLMPTGAELIWWQLYDGTEALCWACEGTFAGDRFTVYIDAKTGREVDIRQTTENESGYRLQ